MTTTTSSKTIQELRWIFAQFGLPENIVTDNGPQFVATEFEEFTQKNGIKHIKVAPYHPRSNGLAERFVQTFKSAMKRMSKGQGNMYQKVSSFLLTYRKTPHATTEAPAMLLTKRITKSKLYLVRPELDKKVKEQQAKQKKYFDRGSKKKNFTPKQPVWVRDYRGPTKWVSGVIRSQTGPVSYEVEAKGYIWKRHAEQLRPRLLEQTPEEIISDWDILSPETESSPPSETGRPVRDSRPPARLTYYRSGDSAIVQN